MPLERIPIGWNRDALSFFSRLRMSLSENRYPLFRDMPLDPLHHLTPEQTGRPDQEHQHEKHEYNDVLEGARDVDADEVLSQRQRESAEDRSWKRREAAEDRSDEPFVSDDAHVRRDD